MFHPLPQSSSMQPLGTCENCGHWERCEDTDDGWGMCRRYAPNYGADQSLPPGAWPTTKSSDRCGEWCPIMAFTVQDRETLVELIPEHIREKYPWLLEPIPLDFIKFRMAWKMFWPYAWHLYVFLNELRIYGPAVAAQRSSLYYIDGRARVSRRPFKPMTQTELTVKDRVTWLLDNYASVFPSLTEDDPLEPPELEEPPESANPLGFLPLYERKDIFTTRERGALRQLGITTWEQLDGVRVQWFDDVQNCGRKTAYGILFKQKKYEHDKLKQKEGDSCT